MNSKKIVKPPKEIDDDTPITPEEIAQYEAQQEFIKKKQKEQYEKQQLMQLRPLNFLQACAEQYQIENQNIDVY